MKKIILLISILIFTSYSKADQLDYITKEQAQKATKLLNEQKEVILWCACCDNDSKKLIKVQKVYFEPAGYQDFYKVMLEGTDTKGNKVTEELDLAYTHIKKGDKACCVGTELGFECDPCTQAFEWIK